MSMTNDGLVQDIQSMDHSGIRINGGYFVFKRSIFQYINDGEELVREPFRRLIETQNLMAYAYDGFWKSMDTFKEKQELDDLAGKGIAPWQLWKSQTNGQASNNGNGKLTKETACI